MCVGGRRPEPLAEVAAEVGGLAVAADVERARGRQLAVERCLERFGRLDALVISSGAGAGAWSPIRRSSAGTA